MKKFILIGLVVLGISSVVYASSYGDCDGAHKGAEKFTTNLNLDQDRAAQVEKILSSYTDVKNLAMKGDFDQIPEFIEAKNAELEAVLSEEEMAQFKENIGQWAKGKDFSKFKKFGMKNFGHNG